MGGSRKLQGPSSERRKYKGVRETKKSHKQARLKGMNALGCSLVQEVECLPRGHEGLAPFPTPHKPGVEVYTCDPSLKQWKPKDQRPSLGYTSLRPAWATEDPVLKKKKRIYQYPAYNGEDPLISEENSR